MVNHGAAGRGTLDPERTRDGLWEQTMQGKTMRRSGFGFLMALCVLATSPGPMLSAASAQEAGPMSAAGVTSAVDAAPKPASRARRARKAVASRTAGTEAGHYFIEFRARHALSYGHTYAAFGRLNARGDIVESEVAGLHPAGDSPVPWMIGHLVMVPSETGPSDGDLEEQYIAARYRVVLNEADYKRVVAYIRKLQASSPVWHAVVYNCNAFVADIARSMGLKAPGLTLLYPATFINTMRELNTGQKDAAEVSTTASASVQ